MKLLNDKEFKNRIFLIFKNDLVICSKYVNRRTKIIIQNKYGKCLVNPGELLNGCKPSIISSIDKTQYFINQCRELHGDRYDYSLVEYINANTKVIIICKTHGEFLQKSGNHLSGKGCKKCGYLKIDNKTFIEKARKIHGDKYDYTFLNYVGVNYNVLINCSIHGIFNQKANVHLSGSGCKSCASENQGKGKKSFINSCKNNKALLYIIKCWNDEEEFYKIGITGRTIKERFKTRKNFNYKYKIIYIKYMIPELIYDLEKEILEKYKKYKYIVKENFEGKTECFNLNLPLKKIIDRN